MKRAPSPVGTTYALLLAGPGVRTRCLGRQLHQRLLLPAPPGDEPAVAGLALRPLFPADPLVRQPAAAQLLAPARPLPGVRGDFLRPLLRRRAVHRPGVPG